MKSLSDLTSQILKDLASTTPEAATGAIKSVLAKYQGKVFDAETKARLKADIMNAFNVASLQKNELMATVFDSGAIKFDFGPDVPEEVKEAAMMWAKRRGLEATEASLNKSANSFNYVVFGAVSEASLPISCYKLT